MRENPLNLAERDGNGTFVLFYNESKLLVFRPSSLTHSGLGIHYQYICPYF